MSDKTVATREDTGVLRLFKDMGGGTSAEVVTPRMLLTGASANSSVGTGGADVVAAAGAYANWVTVMNMHASQNLHLSFTNPATTSDLRLVPGAALTLPFGLANALYGIGSGASTTFATIGG